MGFNITSEDGLYDGALSYNFSKFSDYWYIKSHLHGHKASTIIKYLKRGIERLESAGFKAGIGKGENGWTPKENVFMRHLERMLRDITELVKVSPGHINTRYYCDRTSGCVDASYSDCESEPEELGSVQVEKCEPAIYTYYRHPKLGNVRIDTFAKAAEAHAIALIRGDQGASEWLEFAKKMPDAPNVSGKK